MPLWELVRYELYTKYRVYNRIRAMGFCGGCYYRVCMTKYSYIPFNSIADIPPFYHGTLAVITAPYVTDFTTVGCITGVPGGFHCSQVPARVVPNPPPSPSPIRLLLFGTSTLHPLV